ncbi:Coenzyme F420 hydrogenase/dehydrogenase, beta subunit C-terminal domain [Desulforhopalus vacuolatus]|uniref:coenzyme F420 hydrogenase/dehydrogenase beta subunit N-terminal domain-containing protein n=1 Tax=Desulforhopalus vacuolatus TaxID=40414 RepID=UPI001965E17E|nr:coenzyme F420 hydrogenase/dehydrogenase beta subunit N-terminal domain-containing protein [Desulforhopalus vacuolatus]MBM9520470.1 Coenzyme F420 hydrogenase/dehydrogenase, beta subunit C-terminal domain [Desulforhopalus vacuolatus]
MKEKSLRGRWGNRPCIGCGVCAGVCPKGCLKMVPSIEGGYVVEEGEGCINCGLCVKVCPFDVDGTHSCPPSADKKPIVQLAGNYTESLIGWVADTNDRMKSASGGLLTWVLKRLLSEGTIQGVVCAVQTAGSGHPFFEIQICRTLEEIDQSSGSVYYPTHYSDVLREVIGSNERFAFVGVPCVCTALRRALEHVPALRKNRHLILGLTCGGMRSRYYTDFIAAECGLSASEVHSVVYRSSDSNKPAYVYQEQLIDVQGNEYKHRHLTGKSKIATRFGSTFRLAPCFSACMRSFPVQADAAFMDAWLEPYKTDCYGTNMVLGYTESDEIKSLLTKGQSEGTINLLPATSNDILQAHSGHLKERLLNVPRRMKLYGRNAKMLYLAEEESSCLDRYLARAADKFIASGNRIWRVSNHLHLFALRMYLENLPYFVLKVIRKVVGTRRK